MSKKNTLPAALPEAYLFLLNCILGACSRLRTSDTFAYLKLLTECIRKDSVGFGNFYRSVLTSYIGVSPYFVFLILMRSCFALNFTIEPPPVVSSSDALARFFLAL